ncbi:IS1595 family transposase, partial [Mycolicibacterium austroafricanum]
SDPHPLAELVSRTSELFPLNDNAAEFVPSDTHGEF